MSNIDLEQQYSSDDDYHLHPSGHKVHKIKTSGVNDEILHIGNTKVFKHELVAAFGGTLNPGLAPAPSHKFANPSPLGLCGFALTTFMLSLVNCQARGVTNPKGVIGLAFFYGGFIQLLAGMWEFAVENTFPAVALSSYGGFWMSWAAFETDAFGIARAYSSKPEDLDNVVGFFLLGWTIFTFLLLIVTLRSTVAFCGLFFFLDLTFLLLTIQKLGNVPGCGKAAGYVGIITSFFAWYNAYAGLASHENSYYVPKPLYLPGAYLPK